jgi:uncharacterized Tic20 family protein
MTQQNIRSDHSAAFAEAFFIGNLLFVGFFYLALWVLYFLRYKAASAISRNHIKQALVASTISTMIFVAINFFIIMTTGYASVTALFSLEFYFMLLLPLFLVVGILGFTRAIKGINFNYPVISRFLVLNTDTDKNQKPE